MSARRRPTATPEGSAAPRVPLVVLLTALAVTSCRTSRVMEIDSDPPGALVRLDEEVIGRTPLEYEFIHYGRRRLTLYLPGYRTWSRRIEPRPPWYSRFPLDFFTEVLLPMGLTHRFSYDAVLLEDTGNPDEQGSPAVEEFVERAVEIRSGNLEASSEVEGSSEDGKDRP